MSFFKENPVGSTIILVPMYNSVNVSGRNAKSPFEQFINASVLKVGRNKVTLSIQKENPPKFVVKEFSYSDAPYDRLMSRDNYDYRIFSNLEQMEDYRIRVETKSKLIDILTTHKGDEHITNEQYKQLALVLGFDKLKK